MEVLYLLIGASFVIAIGFLFGFFWAVRNGQYDDSYTPALRMLMDDEVNKDENKREGSDS